MGVDVRRLNTLVVFVWFAASSRLPLGELRIDSCLVIGLGQLHALDWLGTSRLSLREGLIRSTSRIEDDLFRGYIIDHGLHRVHAGHILLRADLSGSDQSLLLHLRLDGLLASLELPAIALEILANV